MVSNANMIFQFQNETTSGTAATSAMIRPASVKATPGYAGQNWDTFAASGSKVTTAPIIGSRTGVWDFTGVQDFNFLGVAAASQFGPPATTTPAGGTTSKQHVFTPQALAADVIRSYTFQWGSVGGKTFQSVYSVFQNLAVQIAYGKLGITMSAISKELDETVTLATTGTTTMGAVVIPPINYDIYVDTTWAELGTTKVLPYAFSLTNPDKYVMDQPISSTTQGFNALVESDSMDYAVTANFGIDTTGTGLIGDWRAGNTKFIRLKATGGIIEAAIPYSLTWDMAVTLTKVDKMTPVSGTPIMSIPFSGSLILDPTSGKYQQLTLVNLQAGY